MSEEQRDGQAGWQKARETAVERARQFWATAEALIREPQPFFVRYFAFAGTRFSEAPPEGEAGSFPYMKPLSFLGHAIGISAAILPLTQLAILDLARENAHMFGPGFVDMLAGMRGRTGGGLDFDALTGIPFLDTAIAGAARFGAYALFGVLLWSMAQKELTVKAGIHCFAYLVAVTLVAQAAVQLMLGLLQLSVGIGLQVYMGLDALTSLVMGAYILVMPSLILPAVLKVERPVVMKATLWALGIWFVVGLFFGLVLDGMGIPIRNFGLHIRL